MKLSVNDWQDFSLKKDIEKLNKHFKRVYESGSTMVFDIAIALGAVIFDRFFDFVDRKIVHNVYLIALIFIIISFLILVAKKINTFIHDGFTSIISRDIREYIDCFDNEIWTYVMMADSFLDLLADNITPDNQRNTFYFSQTCFWLNKAIKKLSEMSQKLKKIFENDDKKVVNTRKVSTARLINLLDIIFIIKKSVNEKKENLKILEEDKILTEEKLTANNSYNRTLENFLSKVHEDLEVNIDRFRI